MTPSFLLLVVTSSLALQHNPLQHNSMMQHNPLQHNSMVHQEHRNISGRRLVRRKITSPTTAARRSDYYTNEVVDYSSLLDPHYPDQPHEERQGDTMGPMGGFVDLLSGTKLTNMLTLTLPIPLCEFSDLCSSVDVALPFTLLQLFPAGQARSERKLGEEQQSLYKWAEDILDRYGLPGQSCVLRAVCDLAGAGGLQGQGLGGRALQALLLMEYAEAEEGLVEYLGARAVGRSSPSQCSSSFSCPVDLDTVAGAARLLGAVDMQTVGQLLQALPSPTKSP